MAHAAAGSTGGNANNDNSGGENGNGNGNGNDVGCVFRAVAAGETAARVRELVEEYATAEGVIARSSDEYEARRSATVNCKSGEDDDETPLEAAHERLQRGDLVGTLLENGADATAIGPNCNALALAIHYGQNETLRVLLRSGRHQVDETLQYNLESDVRGKASWSCRPVHLAVVPPRKGNVAPPPPRIDALEILVREFGADVNGRDAYERTPLHWAVKAAPGHRVAAVDALISLSADLDSRNMFGSTPIFTAIYSKDAPLVLRLLSLGASADVLDMHRRSPLMRACLADEPTARVIVPALMRASSRETRRAVPYDESAIDLLVYYDHCAHVWGQDAIAELLSSGAPVRPECAASALPIAARHSARLERQVAARENAPPPWQMHEAMVKLAFDVQEVRAAEEGVRVRERRVRELEEALRARTGGSERSSGSGEEEKEESGGSGESGSSAGAGNDGGGSNDSSS